MDIPKFSYLKFDKTEFYTQIKDKSVTERAQREFATLKEILEILKFLISST